MTDITITVEDDPVPLVRIMAAKLKRSAQHPDFANLVRGMTGKFVLASHKDPQAVTFVLDGNSIFLKRGVDTSAMLVIKLDLDTGKSVEIKGLWRHPLLAMKAGKLLEGFNSDWTELADLFWQQNADYPGMPASITLKCSEDGRVVSLGDSDPNDGVLIEGGAIDLTDFLTGGEVFIVGLMQGKLKSLCSLKQATVLSDVTKNMMLDKS